VGLTYLVVNRSPVWLLGASALLWVLPARSEPAPADAARGCALASDRAQAKWQAGHLREARELFLSCTKASCGARAQRCRAAVAQLEQDTPSVVPVVTDASGAPVLEVTVKLDGQTLISRLDGRGVPVDPGPHEFSFSTERGVFDTQKVLIVEGQRNRVIAATAPAADASPPAAAEAAPAPVVAQPALAAGAGVAFSAPTTPAKGSETDAQTRGPSALTYVVAGAGLAAVGTSLLLVNWGSDDNERLNQCAPNCSQASVDHVRHLYIAADVGMGVGVVALGVATWLLVSDLSGERAPSRGAYAVDVKPLARGAYATLGGAF
jgi:hypothetical protein